MRLECFRLTKFKVGILGNNRFFFMVKKKSFFQVQKCACGGRGGVEGEAELEGWPEAPLYKLDTGPGVKLVVPGHSAWIFPESPHSVLG